MEHLGQRCNPTGGRSDFSSAVEAEGADGEDPVSATATSAPGTIDGNDSYGGANWRSRPTTREEQEERFRTYLREVEEHQACRRGARHRHRRSSPEGEFVWRWDRLLAASSSSRAFGGVDIMGNGTCGGEESITVSGSLSYDPVRHPLSAEFLRAIHLPAQDNESSTNHTAPDVDNRMRTVDNGWVDVGSDSPWRCLERLHEYWGESYSKHSSCIGPKRTTLRPLKDPDDSGTKSFLRAYEDFICDAVLPTLRDALPADEEEDEDDPSSPSPSSYRDKLLFQAFPCVRVQQPSMFGTIRPHTDSLYGHVRHTVNVWVPLTCIAGPTATLHIESFPGGRDFVPLPCTTVGTYCVGDMVENAHYTVANETDSTRVSIDARVVPLRCYEEALRGGRVDADREETAGGDITVVTEDDDSSSSSPPTPYLPGAYFSCATWCPVEKRYKVTLRGRASRQHGFPHTSKPAP